MSSELEIVNSELTTNYVLTSLLTPNKNHNSVQLTINLLKYLTLDYSEKINELKLIWLNN